MLWTWVPGFGWHIITQTAKSWFYFLAMGTIFWFLPAVVSFVVGPAPTTRTAAVFSNHLILVVAAYALAIVALAQIGGLLLRKRQGLVRDQRLHEIVDVLSTRAGFSKPPTVVVMEGRINAAATVSLSERFLILMGDIQQVLDTRSAMGVVAHELAHMKHRDNVAMSMIQAGAKVLQWQTYLIGLACTVSIVLYGATQAGETRYLMKVVAVLFALQMLYELLSLAFSRAREYMADIGAIGITTPDFRDELIKGMLSVGASIDGYQRHPFEYFRKRSNLWFLQTHPTLADRAEALGVTAEPDGMGVILTESQLS
ncbi:MAG: M48 family metalloprotease [Candidatus Pacebacteria bacterium]|nr:M48 family metalloprotease [Candidatus Paceibacterota bacterium]